MKKIFAIILIVMALSACSTLNKESSVRPQKRDVTSYQIDMENSLMYFSLADVAMDENNYLDAYNALMKAYEYNPKVLKYWENWHRYYWQLQMHKEIMNSMISLLK